MLNFLRLILGGGALCIKLFVVHPGVATGLPSTRLIYGATVLSSQAPEPEIAEKGEALGGSFTSL